MSSPPPADTITMSDTTSEQSSSNSSSTASSSRRSNKRRPVDSSATSAAASHLFDFDEPEPVVRATSSSISSSSSSITAPEAKRTKLSVAAMRAIMQKSNRADEDENEDEDEEDDESESKEEKKEVSNNSNTATTATTAASSTAPQHILIHSEAYTRLLDSQAIHVMRAHRLHSLLRSFFVHRWPNVRLVSPRAATQKEMELFHDRTYIEFIERIVKKFARAKDSADSHANLYGIIEQTEVLSEEEEQLRVRFGLVDDCPIFPELYQLIRYTVGGTLCAIEEIKRTHAAYPNAPITAVHWGGGRHHCAACQARGFCYCNDINVGILSLITSSSLSSISYPRVLYLDIDVHHGDGVEEAFTVAGSVMTCSFHHYSPGVYPGTGALDSGNDSVLNVPLREGIDDVTYCQMFDAVLSYILPSFRPSIVIMCCGVDGLATDRMSGFNLTTRGYQQCVRILKKQLGHYAVKQQQQLTADSNDSSSTASPDAVPLDSSSLPSLPADDSAAELTFDTTIAIDSSAVHPPASSTPSAEPPSSSTSPSTSSATSSMFPPIPLLLLGGGGYHTQDSARAFACMTAAACGVRIAQTIPDHDQYYTEYLAEGFSLHSSPRRYSTNANDKACLGTILRHIKAACQRYAAKREDGGVNL